MNSSTSSSKSFFIGFTLIFFVGITTFIIGSEYIVRTIVAPKSDFDRLRESLHSTQAPYAAFADSHGANGLLNQNGFINLSRRGDNLATILAKAQFYSRSSTAKGVIIQADPHHFASYRLNSDQLALRDDLFKRKSNWFQFLRPVYRQYLIQYWKAFFFSSRTAIQPKHTITRLLDLPAAEVSITSSIRAGLHKPIPSFKQTKFADLYAKGIQALQKKGIKVCLVSFPISSPYKNSVTKEATYTKVMQFYAAFEKQYGVKYFDFSSALEDSQFADPDHLNTEGAAAFTKIVLNACFGLRQ